MYKVVLADDEDIVVEGLKKKINWERLQLEIAGIAYDGLNALRIIEETNPDILITDIIMPVMDGLKLIETVKAMGKDIKTIILSGHDEFSYAQKAMKLGASEYQLKPISIDEIEEALAEIIKDLDNESREERVKNKHKSESKQNAEIIKRHVLASILEDRVDNQQKLMRIIGEINKAYLESKIVVSIIELDTYSKIYENINNREKELIIFSLLNITDEIVENNNQGLVIRLDEKRLAIITFYGGEWSDSRIINSYTWLFCLIKDNIKKYLGYTITIAVGQVVNNIMTIRDSFLKANEAIKYKLIYGKDQIIKYDNIIKNSEVLIKLYNDSEKQLLECFSALDKEGILKFIDSIYKQITINNSYEDLINVCYKLVLTAKSVLNQYSAKDDVIENEIMLLEHIKKFESLDQLVEWMKEFSSNVFDVLGSRGKSKYNSIINYVIDNIEKNYMEELELNNLAKKLFISANYLSTLFKKETGVSFKSYLTNFRLEKAKKLLLDPRYKIYQIANIIGYENEEYLCRLFKNAYGMTCKDFRDRNEIN